MINFEDITEDVLRRMIIDIDSFWIDSNWFRVTKFTKDGVFLERNEGIPDYKTYEELVNIIHNYTWYCEFYKLVKVTDIEKYK